jgi:glycine/D-amino acid oxidase-like deaminating enzyme
LAEVLVIGGGLVGGLLALALAERGVAVEVLAAPGPWATDMSYGGVPWWAGPPGPLGDLMATAPARWRSLEERHGPLGWRPSELVLHRPGHPEERHPYARIDGEIFQRALPAALERAGVGRLSGTAHRIHPEPGGWSLELQGSEQLRARQMVLAAGAGCLSLWPALQGRLMVSWAGVILSDQRPEATLPWGEAIVMPQQGRRQELEGRARELERDEWIVDAGLAPRGAGLLLGQISLVAPQGAWRNAPDPRWMEAQLRVGLRQVWPALAELPGRLVQAPVAFTDPAGPVCGPIAGAPGLWGLGGIPTAFSLAPGLAEELASQIAGAC